MYLVFCGLAEVHRPKKIGSANRKSAKCHMGRWSANLTNLSLQICGFAICVNEDLAEKMNYGNEASLDQLRHSPRSLSPGWAPQSCPSCPSALSCRSS
jgi:hypothetical protein